MELNTIHLRERADQAMLAARASGEMLRAHPHTPAQHKAENDFVTEMDIKSEQLIRSILLGAFPQDGFFGEEEGAVGEQTGRWIVDPIDGTSNFFKGEPLYVISIAYEYQDELVIGCVYCPPTDEMWLAIKGEGASCNGKPIHVSDVDIPRNAFLHMSFCHRDPWANEYVMDRLKLITQSYSDLRRSGSAAYDLCSVAMGRCEGFFELCLHIYDVAAGAVILREAGGCFTAWRKQDDPLRTGSILATNGRIHEQLRELLLSGDHTVLDKQMALC